MVGILAHEAGEDEDGLAGVLGALEGEVDVGAVVDAAFNLGGQFLAAAVGGLADGELPLVHVAHDAVGMGHLGNLDELLAAVPVDDLVHGAGGIVGGGAVVELAIEGVAVGGVGNHGAAVLGGAFGEEEIGAGVRGERGEGKGEKGQDKD